MHDHAHPVPGHCIALFQTANVVIALGYAAVPLLVLRWLNLTRSTMLLGAGFFASCAGTHLWMGFGVSHPITFWWTVEHVIQAICTWGFIIKFGLDLRSARKLLLAARPEVTELLDDSGGGQ